MAMFDGAGMAWAAPPFPGHPEDTHLHHRVSDLERHHYQHASRMGKVSASVIRVPVVSSTLPGAPSLTSLY